MSPAATTPELAAWLVTGEDAPLVTEAVADLVAKLVGKAERSLVLEDFSGDEVDLAAVADACRTPPFLADHRVVVVRDAGAFNWDQLKPLVAYLDDPLGTTRLVVAAGGGALPAKFVSVFRQSPTATVVSTDVAPREAHGWISERLAHAPVRLVPGSATMVESHLGGDLNRLGALLATLETAYGPGAVVGPDDLAPYLGQPGSVPPWDLTDAIDRGTPPLPSRCSTVSWTPARTTRWSCWPSSSATSATSCGPSRPPSPPKPRLRKRCA